jgi:hypothetical protein
MATVLVKKTATHKIYKRKDGRYAVTTLKGAAVNGDDKAAVLLAEGLIQLAQPAPAEPEVEEAPAEEAAAEEAPAEEAEAPAEEAAEEETKDAE